MKLKKIASLALAGLMAVSMLAGCGDNSSNGNGTIVEPGTSSSIVSAFNDGQNKDNKVKISFSSSASLNSDLTSAVKSAGQDATADDVKGYLYLYNGVDQNEILFNDDSNVPTVDGASVTVIDVKLYKSTDLWTEEAVLKTAGRDMDTYIGNLVDTTKKDGMKVDDKYYDYSYTGEASMVTAAQVGGSTYYYVAYIITQTAAEHTITK